MAATIQHNLPEFKREAEKLRSLARTVWKDRAVALGGEAFQSLLEKTEDVDAVDTGAYIAAHQIAQEGVPIFVQDEYIEPDRSFPSQKQQGLPPILFPNTKEEAEQALRARLELGGFSFFNDRDYAEELENGSIKMEPRLIYARASDETSETATRIASEPLP